MPNFLENIFARLRRVGDRPVLREMHSGRIVSASGAELLATVEKARAFVRRAGLQPGDLCALLGTNSIRWVAIDLALMAERIIVVPLYARQAPAELAAMLKDCRPRLVLCGDAALGAGIAAAWPGAPPRIHFEEVLKTNAGDTARPSDPLPRADSDLLTIIYTSGTSGESKGVCLNVGNLGHMLLCTTERLDQLMGGASSHERVFHYLPFNFAGSWILLLSCLLRESTLSLSMDLNRLADEIQEAAPHYFLNVPTLLERVRRGVEEAVAGRGTMVRGLFRKARAAWERRDIGRGRALDGPALALGRWLIFSKIRMRFGENLRAIICGSATLAPETQRFFMMLGIQVLQVYGLTETTGICTMDDPRLPIEPGFVGSAVSGIEMKLAKNEEIIVRGPHIFPGYWNRPEETGRALEEGWFHTGDQGEVNARGNWRIIGRIKNLIILNSGHNIAPEPIEEKIAEGLPGAQQVVLVGDGRGYLCLLVTGAVEPAAVEKVLQAVNPGLPHYRQVRNFCLIPETFSAENGLLTANGKLRRDTISLRYRSEIEAMYRAKNSTGEAGT